MRPITLSQTGVGNSVPIPVDVYQNPTNISLQVIVTGTVTYNVVWTEDDIWNTAAGDIVWSAGPSNLQAATTTQVASLNNAVTAVQLQVTAGTGTAKLRVAQGGVMG